MPPPSRMVAVWGAAGAPGRTTVAVHLAVEAARRGTPVMLIDGDAWSASVAQLLGLDEAPSVAQAARLAGEGWRRPLDACLQDGPAGCAVLAGLARIGALARGPRTLVDRRCSTRRARRRPLVIVDLAASDRGRRRAGVRSCAVPAQPHDADRARPRPTRCCSSRAVIRSASDAGIVAHRTLAESRPDVIKNVRVVVNRSPESARRIAGLLVAALRVDRARRRLRLPAVRAAFERTVWEGRSLHEIAPRSPWLRELHGLVGALVRDERDRDARSPGGRDRRARRPRAPRAPRDRDRSRPGPHAASSTRSSSTTATATSPVGCRRSPTTTSSCCTTGSAGSAR